MTIEPERTVDNNPAERQLPERTGRIPPEPRLPTLRFGLRHMFWFVTVVSLLVAAAVSAPGPRISPLVLLVATLAVAFHIAGTAIGSQLRDHANQQLEWRAARAGAGELRYETASNSAGVTDPVARSSWHSRGQPIRWLPWLIAAGTFLGAFVGAVLLARTVGHRTSPIGVAFGAISTAVVGGWLAFLGGSFWVILRQGWRDAITEHSKDIARSTHRP